MTFSIYYPKWGQTPRSHPAGGRFCAYPTEGRSSSTELRRDTYIYIHTYLGINIYIYIHTYTYVIIIIIIMIIIIVIIIIITTIV